MGTNFYCRIIPTKQRKSYLCDLINNSNDFDKIKTEIGKTYDSFQIDFDKRPCGGVIHLGKRSAGWKFLWNPNIYIINQGHTEKELIEPGHYRYNWIEEDPIHYYIYPLTKKGIWNFINKDNIELYDEYGEIQNKDTFFKEALNWNTWNGEEAWDGKTYEESKGESPSQDIYHYKDSKYIKMLTKEGFKVEWPYTDFYSDDLRFATNTDFS